MFRITLVSALLAGSALSAQAQALPDSIKTAGKIVIATQPNYAPITFKDPATNTLSGFDVELGEAIANLVLHPAPPVREFPSPWSCSGTFDCVMFVLVARSFRMRGSPRRKRADASTWGETRKPSGRPVRDG